MSFELERVTTRRCVSGFGVVKTRIFKIRIPLEGIIDIGKYKENVVRRIKKLRGEIDFLNKAINKNMDRMPSEVLNDRLEKLSAAYESEASLVESLASIPPGDKLGEYDFRSYALCDALEWYDNKPYWVGII